ncbi:MAG: glycosyltransferase [Verrucomicrobiota bacterium]
MNTVPVAVVLTTYNGKSRGFLEKAIQSVLDQTVAPQEFIVVDDGSKDGTAEWVRDRFPQVRVVTKTNGGPASARNWGVQESHSPLVCFLDDDDVWLPRKLEVQYDRMSGPSHPDLVFSAITMINERDEVTGGWSPEEFDLQWPHVLLRNPIWNPSCVMMRREAFLGTGGFNEAVDHKFVEDYEMWIKIAREYRIDAIAEPLILYRSHSTQNSSSFSGILGKVIPIVRSYAAKVPGLDPHRVVAYHLYGGFFVTLHKAGWKPAMELLKANPNGRWRPILLLLRLIGVMLHRVRFVQRRWRRFESRFFLGHPSPREA